MTTPEVIALIARGPSEFTTGPAPQRGPYFVRTKDSPHCVLHDDNWLLKEIHGKDYEWSPPNPR